MTSRNVVFCLTSEEQTPLDNNLNVGLRHFHITYAAFAFRKAQLEERTIIHSKEKMIK